MGYYLEQHKYYCGVDLHAKTMFLCVVTAEGETVAHKNIKCEPDLFLRAVAPYREDIVVGVECMYSWYWLSDLCWREKIPFVLGHVLYMESIHGQKTKSDRIDSLKLAMLLRGGLFPMGYVYPEEMCSTRDLLRRRLFFVRKRGELLAHVQMTHHQYNLEAPGRKLSWRANRNGIELKFQDEAARRMVESDLFMIERYTEEIAKLEWFIQKNAEKDPERRLLLALLKTVPGIGDILSLTLLYEIHDISRFPSQQHFCSYARLVRPQKTSAGKKTGKGEGKIGNPNLKWAFSEAVALMLRSEESKKYFQRLMKKGSRAKAFSTFSHRLGKAVYFMLARKEAFNPQVFFAH